MGEANFYFGRLNFKHQITSLSQFSGDGELPDREELVKTIILDYLRTDGPVYRQTDEQEWYFGDIRDSNEYIMGKFGKVFPEQPTTYDEASGDFVDQSNPQRQADYSMFIIYIPKNIIIYNQRKRVGYQQFREAFAKGYDNHIGQDDALSVNLLQNKADVNHIIQNANVSEAEIDVVPTNPTSDPDMQKLDSHIQRMNATGLSLEVEGPSLDMEEDLLAGGIAMTNNGYGDYRLHYEMGDRSDILTSSDKPATKKLEQPENLSEFEDQAPDLISYAKSLTAYE